MCFLFILSLLPHSCFLLNAIWCVLALFTGRIISSYRNQSSGDFMFGHGIQFHSLCKQALHSNVLWKHHLVSAILHNSIWNVHWHYECLWVSLQQIHLFMSALYIQFSYANLSAGRPHALDTEVCIPGWHPLITNLSLCIQLRAGLSKPWLLSQTPTLNPPLPKIGPCIILYISCGWEYTLKQWPYKQSVT